MALTMVLPPNRGPIPVPGINEETDPELYAKAGELNAWIDYLLHPETHDGPRIYRNLNLSGHPENEVAHRDSTFEGLPAEYAVVSVLERYAGDIDVFFRPAKAVSGISEPLINQTYAKLVQGFFTWDGVGPDGPGKPGEEPIAGRYQEMNVARGNWSQMRKSWQSVEDNAAHAFENAFINFQLYTENCFYVVAEHLVRYRAIFQKASEDIANLMDGLTGQFATFDPLRSGGGVSFDLVSIVVTGLVAVTTTVITGGVGGTAAVVLGTAAAEMIGEAVKTSETRYQIDTRDHLRDIAQQYLDAVNGIAREVEVAVKQLYENLRIEVDKLRAARTYELQSTGESVTSAPTYRDFL